MRKKQLWTLLSVFIILFSGLTADAAVKETGKKETDPNELRDYLNACKRKDNVVSCLACCSDRAPRSPYVPGQRGISPVLPGVLAQCVDMCWEWLTPRRENETDPQPSPPPMDYDHCLTGFGHLDNCTGSTQNECMNCCTQHDFAMGACIAVVGERLIRECQSLHRLNSPEYLQCANNRRAEQREKQRQLENRVKACKTRCRSTTYSGLENLLEIASGNCSK